MTRRLEEPFSDRVDSGEIEVAKTGGLLDEHFTDPAVLEHAHA